MPYGVWGALVVAVIVVVQNVRARRQATALAAEAQRLGLNYLKSDMDSGDTMRQLGFTVTKRRWSTSIDWRTIAFQLLRHPGALVDAVVYGTFHGGEVKAFEYSSKRDDDPRLEFLCALAALPEPGPPLALQRENSLGMWRAHAERDVEVGDAEFDRVFHLETENPASASAFLNRGLRRWLLDATPADAAFEVGGTNVLCCVPERHPPNIEVLLELVRGFAERARAQP